MKQRVKRKDILVTIVHRLDVLTYHLPFTQINEFNGVLIVAEKQINEINEKKINWVKWIYTENKYS